METDLCAVGGGEEGSGEELLDIALHRFPFMFYTTYIPRI